MTKQILLIIPDEKNVGTARKNGYLYSKKELSKKYASPKKNAFDNVNKFLMREPQTESKRSLE